MRIEIVASVAALDIQMLEILTGFDLHAFWQLALKLGDDDCLVVRFVVELRSPQRLRNEFGLCHLHRPAAAKGCSCDGWHGNCVCASESRRLNTSPHTTHSRRHIGFVGKSPLVKSLMNVFPTLSSLIIVCLLRLNLCYEIPIRCHHCGL